MIMQRTYDPRPAVYQKYAVHYLLILMREVLEVNEEQAVLLHCGMCTGDPVSFPQIARLLALPSAGEAEALYCRAIRRIRLAVPGSRLENWIRSYRLTYHPRRDPDFYLSPDLPILFWTV